MRPIALVITLERGGSVFRFWRMAEFLPVSFAPP